MYSLIFGQIDSKGRFYSRDTVVIDVRCLIDRNNVCQSLNYSFEIINMKPFRDRIGVSRYLVFHKDREGNFKLESHMMDICYKTVFEFDDHGYEYSFFDHELFYMSKFYE